jgi:hypothetical protein
MVEHIEPREPPSTAELEDALVELVDVLVAYRVAAMERKPGPPREIREIDLSPAALAATPDTVHRERSWATAPVDRAIKAGINEIGQILFDRLGSLDALRDVLERVAERGPKREDMRVSILDSAFNGVGNQERFWIS